MKYGIMGPSTGCSKTKIEDKKMHFTKRMHKERRAGS